MARGAASEYFALRVLGARQASRWLVIAALVGCSDAGPARSTDDSPDSGQPSDVFGPLGLSCNELQACPEALVCLAPGGSDLGDLSVPGGYCTRACTQDSDCTSFDGAVCVPFVPGNSEIRYCAAPCSIGQARACGNRNDLACWSRALIDGLDNGRVCMPTCNNDDQCPEGSVCDAETNLCSRRAQGGGSPLGTSCNPNDANTCAGGFCLATDLASGGVCTAYCRRGTFPQCGGEDANAVCGWVTAGDEAAGPADVGLCALRCRCDSDCNNPALRCEPHVDLSNGAYPGICTMAAGAPDQDCTQ